ncbi:arginine--tRNA ligase [soil metagenome]
MPVDPIAELRQSVREGVAALADAPPKAEPTLERPPKAELGDYSTNAAMLLAPLVGRPPREVAEDLVQGIGDRLGDGVTRLEVAGPGFVNFFFSGAWYREATARLIDEPELGVADANGHRVLVEFVSANPTGPLTAAGGRHAAYGDALSRLLEMAGFTVGREYYVNDAGSQVRRFAASIAARMAGEDPPEDGYAGEYLIALGEELREQGADPDDLDQLGKLGVAAMVGRIETTLDRFGVRFDRFASEQALYDEGLVDRAMADFAEKGHSYEHDGATWLRTTTFGDDKDRVLVRADGEPTYLASDAAYHRQKFEREQGWETLIDVWGADHHGYIGRVKAALAALDFDPDRFEALIMQLVHLVDGGARAQMSKRAGEFVSLDELLDDIGVDAARFFMLHRSHDTTLDLDLDLARSRSQENPVYYVQYAHARIAGILAKAANEAEISEDDVIAAARSQSVLAAACEPAESALVRRLLELPEEIRIAAEKRAPHRLCAYASATAADFHSFYRDCRVVGAEPDLQLARLGLCLAAKRTIATTLGALGIGAPEQM